MGKALMNLQSLIYVKVQAPGVSFVKFTKDKQYDWGSREAV